MHYFEKKLLKNTVIKWRSDIFSHSDENFKKFDRNIIINGRNLI